MLVSRKWLQDYVFLPDSLDSADLANDLTIHTVEVEEVKKQSEGLDGVVVGKILSIEKHPESTKLSIAQVDVGEEKPRQILFGTLAEMHVGRRTAVALAPTILQGKEIHKIKIAGQVSEGMLCLYQELGLRSEDEPLEAPEFDKEVKLGTPVTQALGLDDVIIDIDNKSMTHRPDLWGHYGMARELSAIYRKKLEKYDPPAIREGKDIRLEVDIQKPEYCSRYMGVVMSGITIEPSPAWLQARLIAVGLRPINNIVDVTNYVMYDLGQPIHAFDTEQLGSTQDGKVEIIVRMAEEDEEIETLDGNKHILGKENLVIADSNEPIALAGIMGGQNSSVMEETTSIILEAANFAATNIRRSSMRLGVRSDSSARFEKALDPNNCELALRKAVEMIHTLCPNAKVVSNVADAKSFQLHQGPVELSLSFLQKKMGVEISEKQATDILERLGFEVKTKKDVLHVIIPTWRATKDVSIADDLIEEIARMYGYGNIDAILPNYSGAPAVKCPHKVAQRIARRVLAYENGFTETYNYSFEAPEWLERIGEDLLEYIRLENPVAKDRPLVRRHLYPNLLANVAGNLHRVDTVKLFEIGKVFHHEDPGERIHPNSSDLLPRQDTFLGIAYASKKENTPFFMVADAAREVLKSIGVDEFTIEKFSLPVDYVHNGRCAQILLDGEQVGIITEFHPIALKRLDIDYRVCIAELVLDKIVAKAGDSIHYMPIPEFPSITRDIAFVVKKEIEHDTVVKLIGEASDLIESVELFDVYSGEHVGQGSKSMAYKIVYRSKEKTLTSEEVEKEHAKVLDILEKNCKAEIRK
ncbi:MAG: phenylalanine--tRNA ligase subunit beta [Candidatus Magasanikbacteria bacterium CG11_big_fil_rev_8_21_14_0_20_39_34]|uniref:Phenylalanine--tRNA ligase beta subunit n=1 Tax=Candidatus Magasanikbacteria bacterium CG11_big_fil_rev_8_21_14_0_20_39_34 TaxID=1974653 RepID=A0A2H0N4K0_9BACT|nr:MAG: phenylalanine--tRNA ligase subunit beta [Candidatus Magasanikbacteria bacterium CG11_big_fil_rev_8_21_14_0_20_39_34]